MGPLDHHSPEEVHLPSSLEQSRITALPPSAYYIPNFISEDEEKLILEKVARRVFIFIPCHPFVFLLMRE